MQMTWKAKDADEITVEGQMVTVSNQVGSITAIQEKTADGYRYFPLPYDVPTMDELIKARTPYKNPYPHRLHTLGELCTLIKPQPVEHIHRVEVHRK
jgi:hypothetical protein